MPDTRTIQAFANYRKASRYLHKADVVVQLENHEDIPFWSAVFGYARPGRHVKYYYADIMNGNSQSGKKVCQRYIPFADETLIVCVDSDFDRIVNPGKLSIGKHVLQTYTYSWENHYCYTNSLQGKWQEVGTCDFNFSKFIDGLNKIIYPVLISILVARASTTINDWHLLEVCGKILHPSVAKANALDNNGAALLAEIQNEVSSWVNEQSEIALEKIQQMKKIAETVGLTQNTAYLYMRGHCIYDLVRNIGKHLSGDKIAFQAQVLDISLQFSGYPEMDQLIKDVKTLM